MKKLYGVTTAMTTPFTQDDKVDVAALIEQTNFLIEKGVNCLYPCGTTGEMMNMDMEERELVAETVLAAAKGRCIVYSHVGAQTLKQTVRLAQHAELIGLDGIGVVTPPFFGLNDRALVQYYKDVASSVSPHFPIYLYNIPQCAANDLKVHVVEEIAAACSNVVGIKYSFADGVRMQDYLKVRNGDFSVVYGPDRLFLPALAMGCDGTVSGCSGPMPEHFVALYQAWINGDIETARKEQEIANEVIRILQAGADMAIFKAVLQFRGMTGGHMRRPLLDLDDKSREVLYNKISPYL